MWSKTLVPAPSAWDQIPHQHLLGLSGFKKLPLPSRERTQLKRSGLWELLSGAWKLMKTYTRLQTQGQL